MPNLIIQSSCQVFIQACFAIVNQTNYKLELNHLVHLCAATPIPLPLHTLPHSCLANDSVETNFIRVSFQLQQRWPDLLTIRTGCFRRF